MDHMDRWLRQVFHLVSKNCASVQILKIITKKNKKNSPSKFVLQVLTK